jgi:Tol biopolymer transport system component
VPVDSDINLAMSRDGSLVAYRGLVNGEAVLFLRSLSSLKALPVDGLPSGIRNIFFSPDGNWIGFSDGTGLFRASVDGGLWIPITDAVGGGSRGATWGPDDTIVFASFTATGLFRVPVGGGEPESVTTADVASGEFHWWPQFLPGGDAVLFTIVSTSDENDAGQIAVVRLGDPEPKRLMLVGSSPRYVDTGYIVYAVGNTLQAVGFDPDRLEVTTAPFPIVDEVHINSELASSFAVSGDGMLVYATGDVTVGANQLVFIHRDGREEQLPFVPNSYTWPRLSSDGNRVAESIASEDIWVGDIRRANWNPVTRDPGIDNVPLWTPDDQSIVFATQRATPGTFSFFQKRADGTGDAVEILKAEHLGGNFKPYDWTPDGTQMLFDYGPAATLDIGIMTVGGDQDWRPLIAGDALEAAPSLSRDGNWIAYASNRSGRCEIYTERFPALTDRTPISSGGGAEALWSPTSDELYYRLGDKLLVVAFNPGDGLDPGTPQVVAEGLPVPTCGRRTYDVSADGERFIFAKPVALVEDSESETELILVQHLFDDIERRMPAR